MEISEYPDTVDPSLFGTYSPLAKAGGYVWDAVLEYRVGCHPDGKKRTVIDGPSAEAREMVAGVSIWTVKDMDEAPARVPHPCDGGPLRRDRDPAVPRSGGSGGLRDARGSRQPPYREARQARRRLGRVHFT